MIDNEFAREFGAHWIEAWNRHDLEQVLSHYRDDFDMSSRPAWPRKSSSLMPRET